MACGLVLLLFELFEQAGHHLKVVIWHFPCILQIFLYVLKSLASVTSIIMPTDWSIWSFYYPMNFHLEM